MRFEVPQFIDVEDKIVGPLTWKQFVYVAGGVGLCVVLFFMLPFLLFLLFAIPVASLAGFLAFHQVNNRPFSSFLEAFVSYFSGSKLYLWRKVKEQSIVTKREEPVEVPENIPMQKQNLAALAHKLELNMNDTK